MTSRKKPPPRRRYTDADRQAVRDARAHGATLEEAAATIDPPCSVDTARRWCRGIEVVRTEPTEKQAEAAAAARDARRAVILERRGQLSDDLLGRLSPAALALLLGRLEEQVDLAPLILEDERRLEDAILSLEALNADDDPKDPESREERAAKDQLRRSARQRVMDARLILAAHRDARIPVRDLVGVLTRSLADHLTLEGEAADAADRVPIPVIFTSPAPDRRTPIVVQLADDGSLPDDVELDDLTDA